jgi:uncharacterized repeat protein (TIGR01451 family)
LSGLFILSTLLSLNIHLVAPPAAMAASEVFSPGAYIVDMGQPTQTIANGLKPYGLIYELVVKQAIPVKWAINPNKMREGVDFSAGGKSYKGSAFIIPAALAAEAATSIATWKAQGVVVDGPTTTSFTAPIYATIDGFPNAVLDFQNGAIAQSYYTNAGIPTSTTGSFGSFNTYRFAYPSGLTSCDDIFVMPHADPAWATHQNLIPFVQSRGFVWAACHSVSVLERVDDPGDAGTLPDMNFLSHVPPATQDSPSLKLFGVHALPTFGPYQYGDTSQQVLPYGYPTTNLWAYPIMQFIGKIDSATQNGSEQVYIPEIGGAQWRDSTAIAVYDDNNTDAVVIPTKGIMPPSTQIKAAKMVYGAAFGNPNNGMVMYEAGHSHAKATLPDNIAAQRAFFNYLLLAGITRGLDVAVNVPGEIGAGQTVNASANATGGAGNYTYQWYSSCGGSFSNPNGASTNFVSPAQLGTCNLRVVVADACSRRSIGFSSALIIGPKSDLAITKDDGQTNVVAGAPVTYTITATNNGPSTVTAALVNDTLPANLSNPSFTPSTGTYNSATGLWTGLNLATGQSVTLTLKAVVNAAATVGSSLVNQVTIAPPTGYTDNIATNNTASDADTITPATADLSVTKTDNQTATTKDNLISYTITVTNNGPSIVNTVTVTDTFFDETPLKQDNGAIGSITATPSQGSLSDTSPSSGSAFTWTGANLWPGQSATITFAGKVGVDQGKTPLRNVVKVAPAGGVIDPTPNDSDDSAFDENTIVAKTAEADLSITKTATATSIIPGNPVTYNLTITNNGADPVTSMTVKDTLPTAMLSPITFTPSTGTYNSATGLWSGFTLAKNGTLTLTVTGIVDPTLPSGKTLANTATVQTAAGVRDSNFGNNSATNNQVVTATPQADLTVTKTDNQTQAAPGGPIVYTMTATNNGPSTVNSLTLTDSVPASITSPSFAASTGSYNSATGAWTGLNLAKGQSITLTLTGTLSGAATGNLVNTATIAPPTGVTDPNAANNSSTDTDTIVPVANLSITKTDNKTNVIPGTSLGYLITVTNSGPSTVTSLTVTDPITPKLLNPQFTPATGSYNAATGQWTGLNLTAGQNVTLLLEGTVAAGATGNLINTATVAPPTGVTDPDNANNSSTDTDTLTPTVDLSIIKTDGQSAIDPGDLIAYTVRVTNNGPSAVSNATIVDAIPASVTNVTWTCEINPATGSCGATNGSGNNLNTTATLNPGAIVTYKINGTVSPTIPPGTLTNIATVAVPTGVTDSNLNNNSSTDTDTTPRPGGSVDLGLTKTNNLSTVIPGSPVTYTITATNNGPGTVNNLLVQDTVPTDLLDPFFSTPYGVYDSTTGEWSELNLAPGESVTLFVDGTLTLAPSGARLINTATIAPPQGFTDPDTSNNTATDDDPIVGVSGPPNVLLIKRITAINGNRNQNPNDNTLLNTFVDDTTSLRQADDNHPNWPSGYLVGALNAGKIKPGDQIEYSIYFLNAGGRDAKTVRICDRIVGNQNFLPDRYGTGTGSQLQLGTNALLNLTNAADGNDRTQFISGGGTVPSSCFLKGANANGTLVMDVTGASGTGLPDLTTMPKSTGVGQPNDTYGFLRFTTQVKP